MNDRIIIVTPPFEGGHQAGTWVRDFLAGLTAEDMTASEPTPATATTDGARSTKLDHVFQQWERHPVASRNIEALRELAGRLSAVSGIAVVPPLRGKRAYLRVVAGRKTLGYINSETFLFTEAADLARKIGHQQLADASGTDCRVPETADGAIDFVTKVCTEWVQSR